MTRPLATPTQLIQSMLVNRRPSRCPVCDRYITPFMGLPVIMNKKGQIIEFVHPDCCVSDRPS